MVTDMFIAGIRAHGIGKLLTQLVSWAGTIYVFRQLSQHELGIFAMAVTAHNFAMIVYDGTLMDSLVQRPPADERQRRAVFSALMVVGGGLAALLLLLAWPIAWAVNEPRVAPLIAALSTITLLTALTVLPNSVLVREMRFDRLALVGAISGLGALGITAASVAGGAGAWGLVAGVAGGAALRALLLNFIRPTFPALTIRIDEAWPHLKMGGLLVVDALLWRLYTSLDVLLLGRWWGSSAAGTFDFAQQVANMPLEKVSTVVNDVALPAYARLADEPAAAARLLIETIRTHAVLGFPVFWGMAAVADIAVPLVFGEQWRGAWVPLAALALIGPLRLIGSLETPAMTGLGKVRVLLVSKARIVPPMVLAVIAGVWFGGVNGAALAWLIVFPICYTWALSRVFRELGVTLKSLAAVVRGPALAAGVMTAGALAWRPAGQPIPALTGSIAIGLVLYPLMLWWVDRPAATATWNRLQRLIGRRPGRGVADA